MSLPTRTDQQPSPLDLAVTSDAETVDAVLSLVADTLDELSDQWRALASAVTPRPGVLHTDSILTLVRDFAAAPGKLLRPRMAHWGWVAAGGLDHGRGRDRASAPAARRAGSSTRADARAHPRCRGRSRVPS